MKKISLAGRRCFLAAMILLAAGSTWASAQVLLPINGVSATSTSTSIIEGAAALTTSNNSLIATPAPGGSGVLGASDSLGDSGFNSVDFSEFGGVVMGLAGANITYNLGHAYNVSNLLIWNFSQLGYNFIGAKSVSILSSTTGALGSFSPVGTFTFDVVAQSPGYNTAPGNPAPGVADVPAQVLDVNIPNAQYIELVFNSNRYDPSIQGEVDTNAGGLLGINEVNFVGAAVVPEPSTYALMLSGLAVLALCIRRKSAGMLS